MIEHEPHPVAVAVDSGNAAAECLHQVIEGREQDVGQDGPFQMAPQAFDPVQTRTIRRQPVDRQLARVGFRAQRFDIGSGPTEALCRTLTARLKGGGKRWNTPNAEALMALAALKHSRLWEGYWAAPAREAG